MGRSWFLSGNVRDLNRMSTATAPFPWMQDSVPLCAENRSTDLPCHVKVEIRRTPPRTSPDLWWAAVCSFRVSAGIGASDVKLFFNTINDSRVNFCMGDRIDHWWHVLVCDCIRGSCIKLPPDLYFNLLTALVFGPCLLPAPLIYFPTQNSLSHFLFLGIESLAHFSMAKDRSFFFFF